MREKSQIPGEMAATFVVRVTKKPNQPWQGNVVWVTERCEQTFSSMQELFELMDSTMDGETAAKQAASGEENER